MLSDIAKAVININVNPKTLAGFVSQKSNGPVGSFSITIGVYKPD